MQWQCLDTAERKLQLCVEAMLGSLNPNGQVQEHLDDRGAPDV